MASRIRSADTAALAFVRNIQVTTDDVLNTGQELSGSHQSGPSDSWPQNSGSESWILTDLGEGNGCHSPQLRSTWMRVQTLWLS